MPYQQVWRSLFVEETAIIRRELGVNIIRFEHIGSTAIEAAIAKPIIDIMAAVESLKLGMQLIPSLEKVGYQHRKDDDIPDRIFLVKNAGDIRTHHLSLTELNSRYWTKQITFRNYLRKHPDVVTEYNELKAQLAEKYPNDRLAYTNAKTDFVTHVLKIANNEI